MNKRVKEIIIYLTLLVVGAYFLILGAHQAKSFLIPVTIAVLLSMVMLPVAHKLEAWGVNRGLAVLISDLVILFFCLGLFTIVGAQVENVAEQWPSYKDRLQQLADQVQQFIEEKTGLSRQQQEDQLKKSLQSGSDSSASQIGSIFSGFLSGLGNFLLVFIYIFFFLFYRKKFKRSILRFFPPEKRDDASAVLSEFSKVSQQYLFGRFLLIIVLCVLYSIGLTISGVQNAVLVSTLAAVLSLIPYIGNIVGVVLAGVFGLISGGDTGVLVGIAITFAIAQFVESYILEPYVVGNRVDLNPVFTIIGVVAGGAVWGIAGMILAIPIMGITKVVCDHIPQLNPMGYLLGQEGIETGDSWEEKIKNKLKSFRK